MTASVKMATRSALQTCITPMHTSCSIARFRTSSTPPACPLAGIEVPQNASNTNNCMTLTSCDDVDGYAEEYVEHTLSTQNCVGEKWRCTTVVSRCRVADVHPVEKST
ncbi:hypothetical protein H257_11160 [Aphanomyces astaci]|uniref:Uncharacterized protein n=1 Tax=Aphanomyces astaci TaxID=112090 RepID=W4G3C3_APHAT|nr:hypothetical protein H257_11160 [Aphanomyces astaci]ETV74202.1 hypothetical protein H257_11160 [Aphanomyces astaci]|eukprot:XP_009836308.1 hypothetical protein H257_11160 [Aphanomyces astaci]